MVGWCAGCEFSEANYILEEAPSLAQLITRDSRVCCRWWKTANADGSKCGWQCCQVHKRGQHLYQSLSRETRLSNGSFDARVPSCTGRASPLHQGRGVVLLIFFVLEFLLSHLIRVVECRRFSARQEMKTITDAYQYVMMNAMLNCSRFSLLNCVLWGAGSGHWCGSQSSRHSKAVQQVFASRLNHH